MDVKKIKEFWGGTLHRFSAENNNISLLDKDTQNFLCKIGLPLIGSHDDGPYEYIDNLPMVIYNEQSYIQIAKPLYTKYCICISLNDSGVYLADADSVRYVNKNVETYVISWTVYLMLQKKYPLLDCGHESTEAHRQQFDFSRELYKNINPIDTRAVDLGAYWVCNMFTYAENECFNHWNEITALVKSGKYKNDTAAMYAFISGKETFLNK